MNIATFWDVPHIPKTNRLQFGIEGMFGTIVALVGSLSAIVRSAPEFDSYLNVSTKRSLNSTNLLVLS